MAETRKGTAVGVEERTSLPTAMAVILVAGLNAATCVLIHEAAAEGDFPIPMMSELATLIITSIPVSDNALIKRTSELKSRTCVILWALRIATTCSGDGRFESSPAMFIPTKATANPRI